MSEKKKTEQHPEHIKVNGHTYRLAKDVSKDDVKESISKAADKAALENISANLIAHCADIQEQANALIGGLDDKRSAEVAIKSLKAHLDVINKFMNELSPTYNRFTKKHPKKKK